MAEFEALVPRLRPIVGSECSHALLVGLLRESRGDVEMAANYFFDLRRGIDSRPPPDRHGSTRSYTFEGGGPIGLSLQQARDGVTVVALDPHGQAARAGVPLRSIIEGIDGHSVVGLDRHALRRIFASRGTRDVTLSFRLPYDLPSTVAPASEPRRAAIAPSLPPQPPPPRRSSSGPLGRLYRRRSAEGIDGRQWSASAAQRRTARRVSDGDESRHALLPNAIGSSEPRATERGTGRAPRLMRSCSLGRLSSWSSLPRGGRRRSFPCPPR